MLLMIVDLEAISYTMQEGVNARAALVSAYIKNVYGESCVNNIELRSAVDTLVERGKGGKTYKIGNLCTRINHMHSKGA